MSGFPADPFFPPECVAKGSRLFPNAWVPVYSLGVWGLDPCSLRLLFVRSVSSRCRRGVVAGASLIPCRGDWRRGVWRAGKVHVRFGWQAWDSGCIDALGKALAGGSVAGVGLRMH